MERLTLDYHRKSECMRTVRESTWENTSDPIPHHMTFASRVYAALKEAYEGTAPMGWYSVMRFACEVYGWMQDCDFDQEFVNGIGATKYGDFFMVNHPSMPFAVVVDLRDMSIAEVKYASGEYAWLVRGKLKNIAAKLNNDRQLAEGTAKLEENDPEATAARMRYYAEHAVTD